MVDIVLYILMGITAIVLIGGILLMMIGGDLNKKYGNKLMMFRVVAQASALLLVGMLFMAAGKW